MTPVNIATVIAAGLTLAAAPYGSAVSASTAPFPAAAPVSGTVEPQARGGRGGGARAAGHAGARTSVNRPNPPARGGGNRPGSGGSGTRINQGGDNTRINRGGDRINTGNINIGNDVNIDVDHDWDHHDGWDDRDYHPVAAGIAFGTAAAVTSAVVGSMIYSLPPSCVTVSRYATAYYQCGNVWYQPQYVGTSVTYVVVDTPR